MNPNPNPTQALVGVKNSGMKWEGNKNTQDYACQDEVVMEVRNSLDWFPVFGARLFVL